MIIMKKYSSQRKEIKRNETMKIGIGESSQRFRRRRTQKAREPRSRYLYTRISVDRFGEITQLESFGIKCNEVSRNR